MQCINGKVPTLIIVLAAICLMSATTVATGTIKPASESGGQRPIEIKTSK